MKYPVLLTILSVIAFVYASPSLAAKEAWKTRCDDSGYCEMYQRLDAKQEGEGSARLAEFAIGIPKGQETAKGVVALPLGILLKPGVGFFVDKDASYKFDINHCLNSGCFAHIDVKGPVLESLKKGNEASFVFFIQTGQKVRIPMSLAGFTKAYKKISK